MHIYWSSPRFINFVSSIRFQISLVHGNTRISFMFIDLSTKNAFNWKIFWRFTKLIHCNPIPITTSPIVLLSTFDVLVWNIFYFCSLGGTYALQIHGAGYITKEDVGKKSKHNKRKDAATEIHDSTFPFYPEYGRRRKKIEFSNNFFHNSYL